MDLIILIGIAVALLIIILTILYTKLKKSGKQSVVQPIQRGVPIRIQDGIPRRAQIARNQRNRSNRTAAPSQVNDEENDFEEEITERPMPDFSDKIGTKKRAKLEAKAEKKAHREVELKIREDKKLKDEIAEEERKKIEEQEKIDEKKQEEAERLAREEKERIEYEEYLKMKEAFSVEEEGFEEDEENEKENQLQDFINYIKENKVVVLEDLALKFKLKTQATIDRITDLQKEGTITGVIDDRGKFIHISEDELKSVAKFIKQRGRVTMSELAENSNNLIKLVSSVTSQE